MTTTTFPPSDFAIPAPKLGGICRSTTPTADNDKGPEAAPRATTTTGTRQHLVPTMHDTRRMPAQSAALIAGCVPTEVSAAQHTAGHFLEWPSEGGAFSRRVLQQFDLQYRMRPNWGARVSPTSPLAIGLHWHSYCNIETVHACTVLVFVRYRERPSSRRTVSHGHRRHGLSFWPYPRISSTDYGARATRGSG